MNKCIEQPRAILRAVALAFQEKAAFKYTSVLKTRRQLTLGAMSYLTK